MSAHSRLLLALGLALAGAGCQHTPPSTAPRVVPASASTSRYDPAHDLGPLFHDVQMAGLFPDYKTFVDARALQAPAEIARRYAGERGRPGFDLRAFVAEYFEPLPPPGDGGPVYTARSMEERSRRLWPSLTRPADAPPP